MMETNEKELIERAKKDPEAFAVLYERNFMQIFRYAMHRTGDAEASYDITSETFMKALKKIGSFRSTGAPFSAWLFKIAINEIRLHYRRKKRGALLFDEPDYIYSLENSRVSAGIQEELAEAQEAADTNKVLQVLLRAMRDMDENYKDALILRYVEGKKISEISQITGKSEGTIKSLLSRGIEKLKKIMEKNEN